MKILTIGAGASWSTKDVENGVMDGLRAAGLQVGRYQLEPRLLSASAYLEWVWKRSKKVDPSTRKPSPQDVQLYALSDVLPRALAHEVDWVVVVSGMFVPQPFLDVMQRAGLPVAVVMTESPYDDGKELAWARFADLVWTNERSAVDAFRAVQPHSVYLPHAWRAGVHAPQGADVDVPAHDVVFVGSCFEERRRFFDAIDWTGIDLGLYGNWSRLPGRSHLRRFVREGIVDNTRAAALYRRAKVGLNLYRDSKGWAKNAPKIAHAESLNPRAYELAACGAFHLSAYRAEVPERFGDCVPTFNSAAEAETLIRKWLPDDAGRAELAAALPSTVAGHSWTDRGRQLADDLSRALPAALARVQRRAESRRVRAQERAAA